MNNIGRMVTMIKLSWLKKIGVVLVAVVAGSVCTAYSAKCVFGSAAQMSAKIDAIALQLVELGCPEVSASHYPALHTAVQKLTFLATITSPRVFVVEAESPAGSFLKEAEIPVVRNAVVFGSSCEYSPVMVITKDLVDLMTAEEVVGIIAHEIAHAKHEHSLKFGTYVAVGAAFMRGVVHLAMNDLFDRCPRDSHWRMAGDAAFLGGAMAAYVLGVFALSRYQERQADLTAVMLTRSKALGQALAKLEAAACCSSSYKGNGKVAWLRQMFSTHPATDQRKKYIDAACLDQTAVTESLLKQAEQEVLGCGDGLDSKWKCGPARIEVIAQRLVWSACPEMSPELDAELYIEMYELAEAAHILMPRVFFVARGSEAGKYLAELEVPFAGAVTALGLDSQSSPVVVVDEELADVLTPAEMTALVACEIIRFRQNPVGKSLLAFLAGAGVTAGAYAAWAIGRDGLLPKLPTAVDQWCAQHVTGSNAVVFSCLAGAAGLAVLAFSRHCQKQADAAVTALTKDKALVIAFEKLNKLKSSRRSRLLAEQEVAGAQAGA